MLAGVTVARWYGGGMVVSRWHGDMVSSNGICAYGVTGAWVFQVGDHMELHWSGMAGAW